MGYKNFSGSAHVEIHGGATGSVRVGFSTTLMKAAKQLALQSCTFERDSPSAGEDEALSLHQASVVGTIMVSVACVEATINEIYVGQYNARFKSSGVDIDYLSKLLAEAWNFQRRLGIKEKVQFALVAAGKREFDFGRPPGRDLIDLIKLRNEMVHFKPQWDTAQGTHANIAKRLEGRFPPSPFTHENEPFFPKRCLGSGCANWAVSTVEGSRTEFFDRWEKA